MPSRWIERSSHLLGKRQEVPTQRRPGDSYPVHEPASPNRTPSTTDLDRIERSLAFERTTTDARAVIARLPRLALAARRHRMTLADLAAALSEPSGNTAALWHTPIAEPPPTAEPPPAADSTTDDTVAPESIEGTPADLRFDSATKAMLEQAIVVALQERAEHIGTEHLLAGMVGTGPADVVAWLAARGATAEGVDALLARLGGDPGVERLPGLPSKTDRRNRRPTAGRVHGRQRMARQFATVAIVLIVMVVVFVLCVWGP